MIPQAIESLSLNAIKAAGAQTTEQVGEMKSQGVVDQIDGWIGVQYPIWTAGQPSLRLPSRPTYRGEEEFFFP